MEIGYQVMVRTRLFPKDDDLLYLEASMYPVRRSPEGKVSRDSYIFQWRFRS